MALTVGCTFAAAVFGFGVQVYAWKSAFAGDLGREQMILLTRLLAFVVLAVVLVFRGGWPGVLAAILMVVGATFDVLGVGISAALAQGLRMMANVNPKGPQDG